MNYILKRTLELTYNAAIDDEHPFASSLCAFLGLPYKFRYDEYGHLESYFDWKLWNLGEQLFFPFRITKNILKIGTEGIWNALTLSLEAAGDYYLKEVNFNNQNNPNGADIVKGYGLKILSYLPWTIASIGQSITSPFAGIMSTYRSVTHFTGGLKPLGLIAATARAAASLAFFTTVAVFAAPYVSLSLIIQGGFGAKLVTAATPIVNWLGNLPLVSTIGSHLAASANAIATVFGINMAEGLVPAATLAGASALILPALASMRIFLRRLLPWDRKKNDDSGVIFDHAITQSPKPDLVAQTMPSFQNPKTPELAPSPPRDLSPGIELEPQGEPVSRMSSSSAGTAAAPAIALRAARPNPVYARRTSGNTSADMVAGPTSSLSSSSTLFGAGLPASSIARQGLAAAAGKAGTAVTGTAVTSPKERSPGY